MKESCEHPCELPSPEQALVYFGSLVAWRAKVENKDLFGIIDQEERELGNAIGKALAYAVVPALPVEALEQENFHKLLAFHMKVDAPDVIIALSRFAANNHAFVGQVEKLIRQGLQGQVLDKVASAAFALLKWRGMQASSATERLTSRLVYLLGANISEGLPALLWTVGQMHVKGYLSDSDVESLKESIPVIFDSADYKSISPFSREAVSVSLVRAECVKLARSILDKNQSGDGELLRVLDEATHDPLPEVRFAGDVGE